MEQHPVPQNVTTFQFRLIGDMTIKQFGYLAGGAVVGYISYKLPLPFFFTWPLAITSVTLGIGLAFVPIEERPMDVWLLSFIKSIYSPTQYLWQKTAPPPSAPTTTPQPKIPSAPPVVQPVIQPTAAPMATPQVIVAKQAASIAQTLEHLFAVHPQPKTPPAHAVPVTPVGPAAPVPTPPSIHHAPIPQRPTSAWTPSTIWSQYIWDPFGWVKHLFRAPSTKLTTQAPTYPDIFTSGGTIPSLTGKKVNLPPTQPAPQAQTAAMAAVQAQAATKEQELTKKLEGLQAELATKTTTDARILELQKQLTDVLSERSKMEAELTKLRAKVTQPQTSQTIVSPVAAPQVQAPSEPTVRIITADTAVKAGLPRLTTFPNVVTGIIKDSEGSLLPAVLVTVRDKEDIPVRALKTNKLGQFAASTPLPSGTYTVDIEDPRQLHFFDRVRITLNGTVMSPIEVTSRSKKQMERSKLEKAIFGNQNT